MNPHNQDEVGRWVQSLIDDNNLHEFYVSPYWRALRKEVLRENKHECQHCKAKGFYKKATHVHHVNYVRRHPRLALSKTYIYNSKERQNLLALCHDCHEAIHESMKKNHKEPLTEERWD